MAQARNALSAVQYVIGTGNYLGLKDGIQFLATASWKKKRNLWYYK